MERRIQKLSEYLRGVGCSTCRGWEFSRVYVALGGPGTEPDIEPRPARCPQCGRQILKQTDVMIVRSGEHDDAAIVGG